MPQVDPAPLTEDDRALLALLERSSDGHFYGAWKGGSKGAGGGPEPTVKPSAAVSALAKGERPSVKPEDVEATLEAAAAHGSVLDLTELKVGGTLKFGGDGLGLSRKDMPQVPSARLPDFLDSLRAGGTKVTSGKVNPQDIRPAQKEVNAAKSAAMLKTIRAEGSKKPVLISRDNYVIDGHHQWGASTALSFSDPAYRMPVLRVDMDAKPLLAATRAWTAKEGITAKALGESAVWDGLTDLAESEIVESISQEGGMFVIRSADGTKVLGRYASRAAAEKRLAQIEMFKHMKERSVLTGTEMEMLASLEPLPLTEEERALLAEKSSSDHFYGPWKGGRASAGGGPADSAEGKAIAAETKYKDHAELISDMEGKWGGDWSEMDRVPLPLANCAAVQIDETFARFGPSPNFKGVRVPPKGPGGVIAEVKRVDPAVPGSAVYLYGGYWGKESHMDALYASQKADPKGNLMGTAGSRNAMAMGIVQHELGHQYMGLNLHSRLGADRNAPVRKELEPWFHQTFLPNMKTAHVSRYARKNEHEAWAELFAAATGHGKTESHFVPELKTILDKHYPPAVQESAVTEADVVEAKKVSPMDGPIPAPWCGFAHQHPEIGITPAPEPVSESDWERLRLLEKSSSDHFYGAWRGGSKAMGGGPAGRDTMAENTDKDGNWNPERVASVHLPYIKQTGEGLPVTDTPTVYMTGGGTASGKTSALLDNPETGIPPKGKAAHVDPDSAKEHIPEYRTQLKRGDKTAAGYAHEESSYMSKAAVAANLRAGHHVVFDTTGDSGATKLGKKIAEMRANGAKRVEGHYASCDVKTAIKRADARAAETGRYVDHKVIRQLHRDVTRTSLEGMGMFDHMTFHDTNGKSPVKMATFDKGKGLTVHNKPAWDRYVAKAQYKPGEMPVFQMAESAVRRTNTTTSASTNNVAITSITFSEAPKAEPPEDEEAFTGWDVDSDELAQIMVDVSIGRPVKDSPFEYSAGMKTARDDIEKEWEAYSEAHPDAFLDIPSELPRTDIDVSKAPDPWGPKDGGKPMKEVEPLALTDRERELLLLMEKDDHFYGAWKGGSAKSGGGPAAMGAKGGSQPGSAGSHHKDFLEDDEYGTAIIKGPAGEWTSEETVTAKSSEAFRRADYGERVNATFEHDGKIVSVKGGVVVDTSVDGLSKTVYVQAGEQGTFKLMHGTVQPGAPTSGQKYGNVQSFTRSSKPKVDMEFAKNRAEYDRAVAKREDKWVIGGRGTETPFTKNGTRYVAVFNPKTREHGFLDMGRDMVVNDKDFYREAAMLTEKDALPITDEEREFLAYVAAHPEDYDFGDLTEAERAAVGLAEKSGDGHFYGAWKGGGKSAGGGPALSSAPTPGGAPGSSEREKAVDGIFSTMPSSDSGPQAAHVEVRTTKGDMVSGRLESKMPGQVSVRQFKDGQGYASIPVNTKDISSVRHSATGSSDHWVSTPGGWQRASALKRAAPKPGSEAWKKEQAAAVRAAPVVGRGAITSQGSKSGLGGGPKGYETQFRLMPGEKAAGFTGIDRNTGRLTRSAPKLPPKGQSVLEKPRTPSPFRMGYNKSGTPRKPSGS